MTGDNDLFYLGAALVTKLFEKNKTKRDKKQPWWKRRLECQKKKSLTNMWGNKMYC